MEKCLQNWTTPEIPLPQKNANNLLETKVLPGANRKEMDYSEALESPLRSAMEDDTDRKTPPRHSLQAQIPTCPLLFRTSENQDEEEMANNQKEEETLQESEKKARQATKEAIKTAETTTQEAHKTETASTTKANQTAT